MIRLVLAVGWILHAVQWLAALLRMRREAAARGEWPRELTIRAGMLVLVIAAIVAPSAEWLDLGRWSVAALLAVFFAGQAMAMTGRSALGEAWSIGTRMRPGAPVRRRGLYRAVRHPIYVGTTVATAAQALLVQNTPALLLLLGGLAVVIAKVRFEERGLRVGSGR